MIGYFTGTGDSASSIKRKWEHYVYGGRRGEMKIGDILLNYRYQGKGDSEVEMATVTCCSI
jgi:hypothetical protein